MLNFRQSNFRYFCVWPPFTKSLAPPLIPGLSGLPPVNPRSCCFVALIFLFFFLLLSFPPFVPPPAQWRMRSSSGEYLSSSLPPPSSSSCLFFSLEPRFVFLKINSRVLSAGEFLLVSSTSCLNVCFWIQALVGVFWSLTVEWCMWTKRRSNVLKWNLESMLQAG